MDKHETLTMDEFETHCRNNLPDSWDEEMMDNYLTATLNENGLKRHMAGLNSVYNTVRDIINFQLEYNSESLAEVMDEVTPDLAEVFVALNTHIDDLELNLREFEEWLCSDYNEVPDVWAA